MNLAICKYDYFEKVNLNLEIVEDDYGNLKINDHASLSETPFTDILKEKVLKYLPTKLIEVRSKGPAQNKLNKFAPWILIQI